MSDNEYEVGSGNVFEDLGLSDPEERNLKAELAWTIRDLIESRAWKQAVAASNLNCTQADISDLCRGRLARFSIDRLIRFAERLGQKVTLQVSDLDLVTHANQNAPRPIPKAMAEPTTKPV